MKTRKIKKIKKIKKGGMWWWSRKSPTKEILPNKMTEGIETIKESPAKQMELEDLKYKLELRRIERLKQQVIPILIEEERIEREEKNSERDFFIRLCKKNIMDTPLDWVIKKTWLQKGGCNIFLIGERHAKRNNSCTSIYDMFKGLINILVKSKYTSHVDILLEIKENEIGKTYTRPVTTSLVEWADDIKGLQSIMEQINAIRYLFASCINKDNSCPPFKVHWTDPNGMLDLQTRQKRFPDWIHAITKTNAVNTDWTESEYIPTEKELTNLLTSHGVIAKEIQKAELVDPSFNMEFAKSIFEEFMTNSEYYLNFKKHNMFLLLRDVNDLYTAARIVSKKMKNVIVYQGNAHTENIINILTRLRYTIMEQTENPQCVGNFLSI